MEIDAGAKECVIRSATMADYGEILTLCDKRYGTGYVDRETVDHWTQTPALFLAAEVDGKFAGFSVFVPETAESVAEHMAMPLEEVLTAVAGRQPLIHKSAAVVTAFEHRGIMKKMVVQQLETAKQLGYGAVFGSAWEHDGQIPMDGVFSRLGFEKLYGREMLWYHIPDYVCVVCKGPCVCSAVIYQKKLWEGTGE